MTSHARPIALASVAIGLAAATAGGAASAAPPEYVIFDIGVGDPGDFGSQAWGVSPDGTYVVGRSLGNSNQAFAWTEAGGRVDLPNLAGRPFGRGNGANAAGQVVGTGSTTPFGSSPLPILWSADGSSVTQIALPPGESLGRAWAINSFGVAVGSVDGGSLEQAAIYDTDGGTSWVITTPAADGSVMTTAYGINDAGLVAGNGIDPNNAARNVGLVHDPKAGTTIEVGALPSANGALIFAMSEAGHVTGASMQNQGSGRPFVWTEVTGMIEVPLPEGTSQGSGRGVNSGGWVVGNASSAFAVPFLYDGEQTYTIQELLPAGSGWDVSMNTSSGALGIADNGVIAGVGELNGQVRAFAMVPVADEPCTLDLDGSGDVGFGDILAVLAAFGTGDGGDVDGDGDTDFEDLLAVLAGFGAECG